MYVKWLWVEAVVEVVVWYVHVCVCVMCLFTCVCAWVKGTTTKKGEKEGKVNLEKQVPTMDSNL